MIGNGATSDGPSCHLRQVVVEEATGKGRGAAAERMTDPEVPTVQARADATY